MNIADTLHIKKQELRAVEGRISNIHNSPIPEDVLILDVLGYLNKRYGVLKKEIELREKRNITQ